MIVETAKKDDFNELLNFENHVFKIKFENKVPKVYRFPENAKLHGVFREDGKIAGGICVLPGALIIGKEKLVTAGIGSVAVKKSLRGRGIMNELMLYAEKKSLEYCADVGFLSGYRFRYQRFGYVPAGIKYVFEVTDNLIARTKEKEKLCFSPIKAGEDEESAFALYSSQKIRFEREKEKFLSVLNTWRSEAFLIKDKKGDVLGYLIYKKDENAVSELILRDNAKSLDALVLFARERGLKNLLIWCCDFQRDLLKKLLLFGEHYRIETPVSIKIFSFKRFIEKMFSLKVQLGAVQSGSLVLKAGEETLKITVSGKDVTVCKTQEKPQLTFTETEAAAALTRPEYAVTDNALFNAWTPLCPFSIFSVDTV